MSTIVTVEGNLTGEPVVRTVPASEADAGERQVANLRIAVNDRVRDEAGEWGNTEPLFYDVAVWGAAAAHTARLSSGDRVMVHGELRVRSYTSSASGEAQLRHSPTIRASMIGASLRYADVTVARAER
jgi:single-stranded DNA-binding protein